VCLKNHHFTRNLFEKEESTKENASTTKEATTYKSLTMKSRHAVAAPSLTTTAATRRNSVKDSP